MLLRQLLLVLYVVIIISVWLCSWNDRIDFIMLAGLVNFLSVLFNLNLNLNCMYIAGTVLGLYEDSRYKSEWKKVHLKQVDLIGLGSGPEVDQKLHHGNHLSLGVMLARDLVNSPANVLTPGQYSSQ